MDRWILALNALRFGFGEKLRELVKTETSEGAVFVGIAEFSSITSKRGITSIDKIEYPNVFFKKT